MLKVATIILLIVLIYGAFYSVLNTFAPGLTVATTFEAVTGKSFDSIQDTGYLETLLGETSQIGIFGIAMTIGSAFILFFAFRKAEKWAWWAMLLTSLITWGYTLVRHIVIGDMQNVYMILVGLLVALTGIMLPIKDFFGKKE